MVSRTNAQNATATVVRNGAVLIHRIRANQKKGTAPVLFLQVFNTNAPTVGTTAPAGVVRIGAGIANQVSVTKNTYYGSLGGLYLDTGLSYAVTTTPTGLTDPTAGDEPDVQIDYAER